MKTTVDISDPLLEEAKAVARREGTTVRALVEEGLRRALAERRERKEARGRVVTFRGRGLQPGVSSFERMLELAYESRGG
jgi:hypothetical protein